MLNLLLFAVIVLVIYTSVRLLRVFDFAAALRGRKPGEITPSENNTNAFLLLVSMVAMFAMFIYCTAKFYTPEYQLPESASEHGIAVDSLLALNFYVISLAFFITQTLLLWFAYKYRYNSQRKATHYAHNTQLEIIWTSIPAVVMAVLVLKGLIVWSDSTTEDPNAVKIELYARQFDWTVRYSGEDNVLGEANYTMINDNNVIGMITAESVAEQIFLARKDSTQYDSLLTFGFPNKEKYEDLKVRKRRKIHQLRTLSQFSRDFDSGNAHKYVAADDDVIVRDTLVLPVNTPVQLIMRSQDVIHSAYLPHFRVHMYCVPGSKTFFNFKPIKTTEEMREITQKPDFEYVLYCNNICGATHFNMMLPIRVVSPEAYSTWLAEKTPFKSETMNRLAGTNFLNAGLAIIQ
jgi:cytochrome c oxidase subunit 2